jgi:hypothetical protein
MNRANSEKVCRLLGFDPGQVECLHINHRLDGSSWVTASLERRLTDREVELIRRVEMQND